MTIPALHIETKTNPAALSLRAVLRLSPALLVFLHTDGTLTVWVRAPLHGRVGVNKVTEIEAGILLEEMLGYQVRYDLLCMDM